MFNNLEMQFTQFMQQMKGQNPTAILNQIVSSGRVNQAQINQAYKQVDNFKSQLENVRKNFNL